MQIYKYKEQLTFSYQLCNMSNSNVARATFFYKQENYFPSEKYD